VQAIGNDIVVTYVLRQEGNMVETDGLGLGDVFIYSSSGQLLRRLEHGSWLNAPWGVALAPLDFGRPLLTRLTGSTYLQVCCVLSQKSSIQIGGSL
jgi:hypothetical protein